MRELKFRTFQENRMFFHKIENYLGSSGIINPYIGCNNAIWMQYTGLKDKNGVEIYEGDFFIINGKKYIVEWHDDLCRYLLTTGLGYDTKNCMDLTCDSIYFSEIIGNLHQKPELIK